MIASELAMKSGSSRPFQTMNSVKTRSMLHSSLPPSGTGGLRRPSARRSALMTVSVAAVAMFGVVVGPTRNAILQIRRRHSDVAAAARYSDASAGGS